MQAGDVVPLEDQLRPELEDTRIEGVGYLELIPSTEVVAESTILARTSELGVVPGIKALSPELESRATSFTDDKALKQSDVPVISARTAQRVES